MLSSCTACHDGVIVRFPRKGQFLTIVCDQNRIKSSNLLL